MEIEGIIKDLGPIAGSLFVVFYWVIKEKSNTPVSNPVKDLTTALNDVRDRLASMEAKVEVIWERYKRGDE